MPPAAAIAIGAGTAIGGVSSFFGSRAQAGAASSAAQAQLQATRESIRAQERGAERGFDIFQQEAERARGFLREQTGLAREELAPLREIGLANLQRASALATPGSAVEQEERAIRQKSLSQLLSARGLTASGTEIEGFRGIESDLARQRSNIALGLAGQGANTLQSLSSLQSGLGQGLANISSNLGGQGGALFGNLGQSIGQTLQSGAAQAGQLNLASAQARAQGIAGIGNAFQTGLLGLGQLSQANAAQAQNQALFDRIFPAGGGGSSGPISPGGFSLGNFAGQLPAPVF